MGFGSLTLGIINSVSHIPHLFMPSDAENVTGAKLCQTVFTVVGLSFIIPAFCCSVKHAML